MKFDENFLPENWKLMPLPNLVFFQEGPGVRKHQFTENGVKLINGRNIVDNKLVLENTETHISDAEANGRYSHFLVDEGDLIIASSGIKVDYFHKKIAFVEKKHLPLCMNTSTIRFKSLDSNILDINYFKHFMKTHFFAKQVQFHITGSAQLNFGPSHLKKMKVVVPPLETQKKIVEILENAEKLKEWRSEADELADEYLKSVFLEMFGTPVRNEKGWEMTNFKEIAFIDKKSIKAELIEENSNYIGLEHLESGTGKILEISSAKKAGLKSNKYLFDDECVLYGKLRPYLNKVALPNFEGVCSTDILPIRPKEDKSNKYFIKSLLSLDYYIKKSTEQSTGANLPRISPKALESFKVYAPPITLQNQFAQIVQQVETLKTHQSQSKQEIDNLFNTLMQKAFKGELVC